MKRRSFLKASGLGAIAAGLGTSRLSGFVPAHIWDGYDFGPGPAVKKRLNQGPFPIYEPEVVVPGSHVVMATSASKKIIQNFGMGLVVYLCDEVGPPKVHSKDMEKALEDLVKIPFASKIYIRVDWRDVQKQPGKLNLPEHWKIAFDLAKQYGKRVGFRVQLMSPVIEPHSVPDFLADKISFVKLGTTDEIGIKGKVHYAPRYDHPEFIRAYTELNQLLADKYNGHPDVEYIDTFMYGFWGEGHTWPFKGNPFPDYTIAENTSVKMFEIQNEIWDKTPLTTNTQPDWSRVGNSEVLDRTIRSHNWLRTDTIYIENRQIEALSNRPVWCGATIEAGMSDGTPDSLRIEEGIPYTDRMISHIKDVSPHYMSLWNWHNISSENILRYYNQYPETIDEMARNIGYRVRPSWIWHFERNNHPGLIFGMVNDGLAGVPGVLCLTVFDEKRNIEVSGCLDAGYPKPGKVRQAQIMLPPGTDWKGLKVKAEIIVKGIKYPVQWACHQKTNEDNSLTLRPTRG